MTEGQMEDREKQRKDTMQPEAGNLYAAMLLVGQNALLTEFLERTCGVNQERLRLLKRILYKMKEWENDELESEIYLYGSLIKEEDLMARQMFLWLYGMLAEGRRRVGNGENQE